MLRASLLAGAALTAAACYRLAARTLILGSGEGRWYYGYNQPASLWPPIVAALLAIAIVLGLLRITRVSDGRREWLHVLGWLVAAFVVQGILRTVSPDPLGSILASDAANSFYGVSQRFDAGEILSQSPRLREHLPLHAQSNMPGKALLTLALQTVSNDPQVLAWIIVALSNLGALLMYVFVRDLFRDRRIARFAAILYLFVPARIFFLPLMNTVTPVVILGCAVLLARWLTTGRAIFATLFGASLYALVFFEPLPLVMGLLFATLIVRAVWLGEISYGRLISQALLAVLAFGVIDAAVYLTTSFDLVTGFRKIGAHAVEFNATQNRPYSIWVRENVREFFFGMGLCQAVAFWAAFADGLRGPVGWLTRLARPISLVCASLLSVLAVTDLLGVNRGEVVRLWIFLACFFQIPAAYVCARLNGIGAIAIVLATSIFLTALAVSRIGFIIIS